MPVTMKDLGLDKLGIDDRTLLGHELLNSVDREVAGCRLTDAQVAELERRIAEDDSDPDGGIPWEQVRDEALARIRARRQ